MKIISHFILYFIFSVTPLKADVLFDRVIKLDQQKKIIPYSGDNQALQIVVKKTWEALKKIPMEPNGFPSYYTYPIFKGWPINSPDLFRGVDWIHNPASLFAMITESALEYYAFSGDQEVLVLAQSILDFHLNHGMTKKDDDWSEVPYASSNGGELQIQGADNQRYCMDPPKCSVGDGIGFIEPDKVGELGLQFLRFYQVSHQEKYLQVAIQAADALVKHQRMGNARQSPWPFRVDAKTGRIIKEEYTAHILGAVQLFQELSQLKLGQFQQYEQSLKMAWAWLEKYPLQNNAWSGYFEDIAISNDPYINPNQLIPLETARLMIKQPLYSGNTIQKSIQLVEWVKRIFGASGFHRGRYEAGVQWGAETISEQKADMDKMPSHTARYASLLALLYEKTGNKTFLDRSFRSLSWTTYFCDDQGLMKSSMDIEGGSAFWFSDGYGDYSKHILRVFASAPQLITDNQNHLLRSTSVVQNVFYSGNEIRYTTFHSFGVERLRLIRPPLKILIDQKEIPLTSALIQIRSLPDGTIVLDLERKEGKNTVIQL